MLARFGPKRPAADMEGMLVWTALTFLDQIMERKKEHLALLDLSASPQVKRNFVPKSGRFAQPWQAAVLLSSQVLARTDAAFEG